jgi:DNA polymerase-3 subunit alpha/error-prone DNA polymerase
MAAVLANWGGYYSQRVYLSEARRMRLVVRPPHINYSSHNFSVRKLAGSDQQVLFMGLNQVKELTQRTIERIIRHSPFTSLDDFLTRVDPRVQEAENLAKIGAMEGLGKIPSILQRLEGGVWQKNQMNLFEWTDISEKDWPLEQKVNSQIEILDASLEAHPLELVAEKVANSGAISTIEAVGKVGQKVTVAGIRQTSHRIRTAKGDSMLFLTLEDQQGILDSILFPEVYRRARPLLDAGHPFLLSGTMEMDTSRGEAFLRAETIRAL